MLGLLAGVVSCFMSGFAVIYFEKMLKGTPQTLLIRNVQLSFLGVIISILRMIFNDYDQIKTQGFFFGYNGIVVFLICSWSIATITVTVVVKYASYILKKFAVSFSITIYCIVSLYFFDYQLSPAQFTFGATLVMVAFYLYIKYEPTQQTPLPQNSTEQNNLEKADTWFNFTVWLLHIIVFICFQIISTFCSSCLTLTARGSTFVVRIWRL